MNEIDEKFSKLLGVDELNESDREAFMERVGTVVVEAALMRLLATLSETQVAAIEAKMQAEEEGEETEAEDLFAYLIKHHPEFETIIGEEMIGFRQEAEEILSGEAKK